MSKDRISNDNIIPLNCKKGTCLRNHPYEPGIVSFVDGKMLTEYLVCLDYWRAGSIAPEQLAIDPDRVPFLTRMVPDFDVFLVELNIIKGLTRRLEKSNPVIEGKRICTISDCRYNADRVSFDPEENKFVLTRTIGNSKMEG